MHYFSLFIAIVLTGLLLSSCDNDTDNTKKRKNRSHLVNTVQIKPENNLIKRRFNAVIDAPNTIKISNQIAGTLLKISHRPGTLVKKGDILIKLDDSLTKAEYQKALASLDKAKQDLNRINKLLPRQLASAEELSAADTDLKLAKAEVTLKKIQLERSTIKAPFSGVISERNYEPGDSVVSNTHLLTLVDNSNLIAKSAVPEAFLASIKINQKVKLDIPALSYQFDGHISSIYPTVDPNTQQVSIEISFEHEKQKLYPGLFAEIEISQKINNSILIPVNAVQYDTQGSWVYTVNSDKKANVTRITTGRNIGNKIEIKDGLVEGNILITRGFVGLRPGKKVSSKSLLKGTQE